MKRRDFIFKTGLIISASTLSGILKADHFQNKNTDLRRDEYSQFKQPIMQVLAIGLNTPSAHNTQAFKFKIISEMEAELYLDMNQILPETDPPSRQLHISSGCFLELVSIGSTLIQCEAEIKLFPAGRDYSTVDFGIKPIAFIRLIKQPQEINPLAKYIFERHTSRLNYSGEWISKVEFEQFKTESELNYSSLIFQNNETELHPFLTLFKEAMKTESSTFAKNEETRRMWRFDEEEMKLIRNGLTWESQGIDGFKKTMAKAFLKNNANSWNDPKNVQKGLSRFYQNVDSSRGIVYWITNQNTVEDWVQCGRDILRFWLVLTKHNLYCHPLNQAIQEFSEMDILRNQLNSMLSIPEGKKIQMIVRIGRSEKPFVSYRKHLSDFVLP